MSDVVQPAESKRAIERSHVAVSLLLLPIFVGTCVALDMGASSPSIARRFDDYGENVSRNINRAFVHQGVFGDAFNGLMLVDAPNTKYEAGGVYFFGSSNLVFAAQFAFLPEEVQMVIHNFGFPGANPTQIFQLIRYLEQQHGFLNRGAAKTHVAICLTENDLIEEPGASWFLPSALRDTGLFTYDKSQGIAPVPMSGWARAIKVRELRWFNLMQQFKRATTKLPPASTDVEAFRGEVTRLISTSEPEATPRQVAELGRLLDYLKARNIDVTVVRLPKGSWAEGSALDRAFTQDVTALCTGRGVPILDLSHLLRDDEFMDAHHPTFTGALKERDALARFAAGKLSHAN
jgi:hypothetical protein